MTERTVPSLFADLDRHFAILADPPDAVPIAAEDLWSVPRRTTFGAEKSDADQGVRARHRRPGPTPGNQADSADDKMSGRGRPLSVRAVVLAFAVLVGLGFLAQRLDAASLDVGGGTSPSNPGVSSQQGEGVMPPEAAPTGGMPVSTGDVAVAAGGQADCPMFFVPRDEGPDSQSSTERRGGCFLVK